MTREVNYHSLCNTQQRFVIVYDRGGGGAILHGRRNTLLHRVENPALARVPTIYPTRYALYLLC